MAVIYDYGKGYAWQVDRSRTVPYDRAYFEKYAGYAHTPIGGRIARFRTQLTEDYRARNDVDECAPFLDVGIGAGTFIENASFPVVGYDVNPVARSWLIERDCYFDPYHENTHVLAGVTFWDSLEHIAEPKRLLARIAENTFVFVSIPIFAHLGRIHESKHFRPNEHFHYFTREGFRMFMRDAGFRLLDVRDGETQAGREDILTFVFKKERI